MPRLFLDIETRSACDLRKTGAYVYAEHPTTEIIMAAWAIDDGPVALWLPGAPERVESFTPSRILQKEGNPVRLTYYGPIPPALADALADPAVILTAHNASFERTLLAGAPGRHLGIPDLSDVARWDCTAARAACFGLPRTLEGAAAALGLDVRKDKEGHALMMRMCRPRAGSVPGALIWNESPEQIQRLGAYCCQDVEVERAIHRILPTLPPDERGTWETTEEMNDRGVRVDADLLLRVSFLIEDGEREINARLYAATGGAVKRASDHGALTRWLAAQGIDDVAETGIGKAAVSALIDNPETPDLIRAVLFMRREGGKSSASKYRAILNRLSADGRLRGALVYCGAAATGRWSSRGAQLQNLPRGGAVKNTDGAIRDLMDGATLEEITEIHGPALVVASELLRPTFTAAPGHWLARGDYSQIEARVICWLAGADWKLQAFRDYDAKTGPDLYRIAAAGIYSKPIQDITGAERQIGKVGELALGFEGGKGAFLAMAKGYGVRVSEERAEEIKNAWRRANPEIAGNGRDAPAGLWRQLDAAAVECMRRPAGEVVPVGPLGVRFERNRAALSLRLPSGRCLFYWTPELRDVTLPWGVVKPAVVYRAEDAQTKRWSEFVGYGGLWAENLVQATARELMADALRRLRSDRPVLTVHDEGIVEVSCDRFPTAAEAAEYVESVMRQTPAWAAGLPVAADSSAAARYVKA